MADVDRFTRKACLKSRKVVTMSLDDLSEAVWFAIVEELYDSNEYPSPTHLITVGNRAAARANQDENQVRGFDLTTGQIRARFTAYWGGKRSSGGVDAGDGFSDRLIENLALPQVLSRLSPGEYEALAALAVHESQSRAAEAIGVHISTFETRLREARQHVKELWFEHETPRSARPHDPNYACPRGHKRSEHGRWRKKANNWDCRECERARVLKRSRERARLADPENEAA